MPQKQYALILVMVFLCMVIFSSTSLAQEQHQAHEEIDRPSLVELNPGAGEEIGFVYEAFLSPQQEGGEEEDTPLFIPPEFRSTAPSVPRNERTSKGHGVIEFTNDLSRAYVYLAIENVVVEDIVMLHLHCGRPGQLGPIIVDFGMGDNLTELLADGYLAVEIRNEDLEAVVNSAEGLIGVITAGCPITDAPNSGKFTTIAGLEFMARRGEIYFNLHTAGQVYFGDMRGQVHLVEDVP
jgi:hypothetical protein